MYVDSEPTHLPHVFKRLNNTCIVFLHVPAIYIGRILVGVQFIIFTRNSRLSLKPGTRHFSNRLIALRFSVLPYGQLYVLPCTGIEAQSMKKIPSPPPPPPPGGPGI